MTEAGGEPQSHWSRDELVVALERGAQGLIGAEGDDKPENALERIVRGAMSTVPGTVAAGVCVVGEDGHVRAHQPSSTLVAELDALQIELGEGPCLDPIRTSAIVDVADFAAEDRWPRFAAAAAARGMCSLLSFHLFARRGSAGALNLYAEQPRVFGPDAHHLGRLFAAQAAVALAGAQQVAGLTRALESRDVIGQAKGILMERFDLDASDAFSMLVESSQTTNIKLATVAAWLANERGRALTPDNPDLTG